jgi:hypothetical protein
MDIIVTTPKSEMANAAQEAADARSNGGGEYFRRFHEAKAPRLVEGDRVYYVEAGFVRGYCLVIRTVSGAFTCETTGHRWGPGFYAFMDAESWRWIRPIPMTGFQGFRYVDPPRLRGEHKTYLGISTGLCLVLEEGGWLDPRPKSCRVCGCTEKHGCPPPEGPCSWIMRGGAYGIEETDLCTVCRDNAEGRGGQQVNG